MDEQHLSTDVLESILDRNLRWIAAADAKVPPVLAIDTAMLGVLAAILPAPADWQVLDAIVAALAAVLLAASILKLVVGTFPRVQGPKGSLIFFGGIASRDSDQYYSELIGSDLGVLHQDFVAQIHRNAQIAETKYDAIKAAMILLLCSIPFWLVAIAVIYADAS